MTRFLLVTLVVAAACAADWRSKVPPKYLPVAEVHHASCGGCHTRVEPGQRTRAQLEKALVHHHTRVKMADVDWPILIDYLSQTP
jgi:hypothetical protein